VSLKGAFIVLIARKLKRSLAAVYLRASKLAVALGGGRKKRA
jgi:hypothetical protein